MSKGDFRHLLEKQRNKETHYFFDKYLPKNLVAPSVTPTSSITPSITPTSSITPSITPTPSPSSFVCGDGCFEYIVSNLSSTLNLNISYVDCTTGIQTFDTIPTNSQATYCSCGQPIRTSGSENWSFSNQGSCTPTPPPNIYISGLTTGSGSDPWTGCYSYKEVAYMDLSTPTAKYITGANSRDGVTYAAYTYDADPTQKILIMSNQTSPASSTGYTLFDIRNTSISGFTNGQNLGSGWLGIQIHLVSECCPYPWNQTSSGIIYSSSGNWSNFYGNWSLDYTCINPTPSITPTPTPSSTPLPVPQPLQFTVDTSLGDGTTTVYEPDMYRNTVYSAETTDAVYSIDWGDGNNELLYFNDSPSYTLKGHTYSSGGIYTISVKCANSVPWRAFRFLGYLPVLDKVTAITDWGNQFGQIASPFKFSVFDQSNFTSVPGDLDTTNIAANGTEGAFAQTSFTGDVTNFVNLSGRVNNMFSGSDFNQDITGWDVSNITDMTSLFALTPFNQNISGWTTSGVTKMSAMFTGNEVFNQPIGSWDVSNVTTMNDMFGVGSTQSSAFNQPLNTWDTSSVTTMESMFVNATSFNQPLNNWDTSNVLDMNRMFNGATSFNQSLADWDISSISTTPGNNSMENMLDDCGMSTSNYDATLIGWEGQASTPSGVTLGAQGLTYTLGGAAEAARTSLVTTYGWTITGDSGV